MSTKMDKGTYRRFPDAIIPDGGEPVRISGLNPNTVLKIRGRSVKVSDIPVSWFTLECTHTGQGIAVKQNDTIFCSECGRDRTVSRSRS